MNSADITDADLLGALRRHFGFAAFRPGQRAIIEDVLAGRDVLAIMPTGGGKSLCFQLPALLRDGVTIVVSPLIALMQDQVRLLEDNGISATLINSSLDGPQIAQRIKAMLSGEYRLAYLAPERLLQPEFVARVLPQLLRSAGIAAVVIDEAHCVSEWGHDFRPEYRQLARLRELLPAVPILAFTATATLRVRDDIVDQLALREPARHVMSFNRPNLYYEVRNRTKHSYRELLARAQESNGPGIVYCLSRRRVDELAERLRNDGVPALPYHAGLDAQTRTRHQDDFIRDNARVIVATIAFGMGINKPDVRWVVHYDLPRSLESYYQESGRAGRDGDPARCTLYFGAADIRTAEFLIEQKLDPVTGEALAAEQRIARQQLRQVLSYADSSECRRAIQLRYFGEQFAGSCGACDNCCEPRERMDRTREAQQFLSCVARLAQRGERYGVKYIVDVLRGADHQRIHDRGHARLSVYGIGREHSAEQWRDIARALLHQGLVQETHDGYPVMLLNAKSWEVMRGQSQVLVAAMQRTTRSPRTATASSSARPEDSELFERLRQLRKQIADANNLPPYVIFHDATLRAMSERRPGTLEQLAGIPGVGQTKLARYGDTFLQCIRNEADAVR